MAHKVLIVDDSKLARMAINRILNSLRPDWTSFEAASSEEAVKAVEQVHPDIALVDFNMPGRDGLDLAAELRRSNPHMAVALISANQQQAILDRAREVGVRFLSKPLTEQALAVFLQGAVQDLKKGNT